MNVPDIASRTFLKVGTTKSVCDTDVRLAAGSVDLCSKAILEGHNELANLAAAAIASSPIDEFPYLWRLNSTTQVLPQFRKKDYIVELSATPLDVNSLPALARYDVLREEGIKLVSRPISEAESALKFWKRVSSEAKKHQTRDELAYLTTTAYRVSNYKVAHQIFWVDTFRTIIAILKLADTRSLAMSLRAVTQGDHAGPNSVSRVISISQFFSLDIFSTRRRESVQRPLVESSEFGSPSSQPYFRAGALADSANFRGIVSSIPLLRGSDYVDPDGFTKLAFPDKLYTKSAPVEPITRKSLLDLLD